MDASESKLHGVAKIQKNNRNIQRNKRWAKLQKELEENTNTYEWHADYEEEFREVADVVKKSI